MRSGPRRSVVVAGAGVVVVAGAGVVVEGVVVEGAVDVAGVVGVGVAVNVGINNGVETGARGSTGAGWRTAWAGVASTTTRVARGTTRNGRLTATDRWRA
jgi:hypothetical protein